MDVTVTTARGTSATSSSDQFTYIAPAPVITSVGPNPVTGSNSAQPFTINGSNFVSGANVTLRDLTAGQTFANRTASSFNSTQIVINPIFTTAADNWSVEVINPDGQSSGQFPFQVIAPTAAPVVTLNPTSQTVNAGQTATFTVGASGNPTPTVQWQQSTGTGGPFTDIPGATSTTYTIASTTVSQNGYQYQAVFTNLAGSATTTAASLTVRALWIISVSPNPVTGSTNAQTLTVNGKNFASKATVTLRDLTAGKTLANLKPTTANSSGTQLTVSATFGLAADNWSAEVINPNGQSSGQFPFQVVAPAAPAPTCRLTVNPASISPGQSATLTWTSTNATGGTIDNSSVGRSGSQTVTPTQTTTYTGIFVGSGGDVSAKPRLPLMSLLGFLKFLNGTYTFPLSTLLCRNFCPLQRRDKCCG